ncbi:MAG TPA: Crp/Fnr family transcriptional regulator [Desulfosporosinus sp.]|nr:Crp/Fnr family transcriptional regulator [Desulfosporosinus sp.]
MTIDRHILEPIIPEFFHSVEGLDKYMHLGHTRSFTKGSILLSQGTKADSVLYVHSGCLELSIGKDDGQNKFLFHIREHSIGMTIFLSTSHELQLTAIENSTVCFFSIEQLLEIFHDDDQLLLDFLQNVLTKTYYFMVQARDLNYSRPSSRVFRLVYNLCIAEGTLIDSSYHINTNLSQKAIGEITGTHYVTVCKLFNLLNKQGVAKKTKDKIIVYNLERLKELICEVIDY